MSIKLNFCRSVPPEFLRSFFQIVSNQNSALLLSRFNLLSMRAYTSCTNSPRHFHSSGMWNLASHTIAICMCIYIFICVCSCIWFVFLLWFYLICIFCCDCICVYPCSPSGKSGDTLAVVCPTKKGIPRLCRNWTDSHSKTRSNYWWCFFIKMLQTL